MSSLREQNSRIQLLPLPYLTPATSPVPAQSYLLPQGMPILTVGPTRPTEKQALSVGCEAPTSWGGLPTPPPLLLSFATAAGTCLGRNPLHEGVLPTLGSWQPRPDPWVSEKLGACLFLSYSCHLPSPELP
ncbi:hypothetical protein HJG60_009346 [Phyllostomus discolor]|uniref:Uncharacterized protein n=1 Tax=Phyllostomus discolor TaxID=89673 RepID=A0A834DCN6_9CHIR|nr:hypothetical protein HJG60_009346 [Phyllostomus discolor]